MTNAPPPVTILNVLPSVPLRLAAKPVTISASSADGTFHRVLNSSAKNSGTMTTAADDDDQGGAHGYGLLGIETADEHEPRRLVLDDHDLRVRLDGAAVDVAGQEGLDAAADRHHDLARAPRLDRAGRGDPASAADGRRAADI